MNMAYISFFSGDYPFEKCEAEPAMKCVSVGEGGVWAVK